MAKAKPQVCTIVGTEPTGESIAGDGRRDLFPGER